MFYGTIDSKHAYLETINICFKSKVFFCKCKIPENSKVCLKQYPFLNNIAILKNVYPSDIGFYFYNYQFFNKILWSFNDYSDAFKLEFGDKLK